MLAHLDRTVTVTVTASPNRGLEPTLDLSERLVRAGYPVVPHLSARLVRDRAHLDETLDRLLAAGIRALFVPAGDADTPAGEFEGAARCWRPWVSAEENSRRSPSPAIPRAIT